MACEAWIELSKRSLTTGVYVTIFGRPPTFWTTALASEGSPHSDIQSALSERCPPEFSAKTVLDWLSILTTVAGVSIVIPNSEHLFKQWLEC
jgi:hypothetical protein